MEITTTQTKSINPARLTEARKEKGLSQSDVARSLGFDRRQVWQFENGGSLTLEHFTKLMQFYGKPFEYFLQK